MRTCAALRFVPSTHGWEAGAQPFRELGVAIAHYEPEYQTFCAYDATTAVVVDGVVYPSCQHHASEHAAYLAGPRPGWLPPLPVRWGSPSAAGAQDATYDPPRLLRERVEEILRPCGEANGLFGWAARSRGGGA